MVVNRLLNSEILSRSKWGGGGYVRNLGISDVTSDRLGKARLEKGGTRGSKSAVSILIIRRYTVGLSGPTAAGLEAVG